MIGRGGWVMYGVCVEGFMGIHVGGGGVGSGVCNSIGMLSSIAHSNGYGERSRSAYVELIQEQRYGVGRLRETLPGRSQLAERLQAVNLESLRDGQKRFPEAGFETEIEQHAIRHAADRTAIAVDTLAMGEAMEERSETIQDRLPVRALTYQAPMISPALPAAVTPTAPSLQHVGVLLDICV